ncbi:MAG: hypothetical protein PHU67_09710 [Sulfurovum sp.]|nr:hypothetical protein [Sulfurovum sp.]MDD3500480.1 hypothetical protein [Sulfurovum sp.]
MKIKKSFIASSLAAMSLLMSGCGGSSSDTEAEPKTKASERSVAIDFSAVVGDQGPWCVLKIIRQKCITIWALQMLQVRSLTSGSLSLKLR